MQSTKTFYEKCRERCDRLMKITLHLNQTYMILLQLRDLRLQKGDVFEKSPLFYQTAFRNCTLSVFIELCKMYDANTKGEGTYALLRKMSCSIELLDNSRSIEANAFNMLTDDRSDVVLYENIEKLVSTSLQKIKNEGVVLARLRTLRDKYYAHYEIMTEERLAELLKNNRITYEDLKQLIVLNTNILNALFKCFFDATMLPLISNYDDLKSTVCCVETVEEQRQQRLQKLKEMTNQ